MPIGSTNISMDAIATELNLGSAPFADNHMYANIYATANGVYTSDSGSYHNLNMALSGLTDNFKVAVGSPYFSASNMGLKNWAGYDHDAPVMLRVTVQNNCPDIVNYDLEIAQTPGPVGTGTIFANGALNPGQTLNVQFLNTTVAAFSTFANGGFTYFINAIFSDGTIPPARCSFDVISSSDTDNMGNGLNRENFTDVNGTYNIIVSGLFDANLISGDVWNDSGNGISWNKRTSFFVEFT